MTARTRADLLLLAGFSAFLFFYGLGAFGLIGADEPRYAQVAREMLDHRDWITPLLGGQPWLEKPPLYYWQAMIAYSIFGVSDTAARIPSAFDATLLVVAVYLFFWKFRRGVEIDAALMTASCAGVIGYARAASTDMPLAAAFCIGMLAWWAWRESRKRIYLALFYVFIALGMLAKGPVAPFLAGLIIVVLTAITGDWRLIPKTLWLPGIALFVLVASPWYILVQLRNPQFFREFILQHNLERFSTNRYHHPEPLWYYFPVLALALVPWIVFVIASIAQSLRIWWAERASVREDRELQFRIFACCWLVVPVVFFSLSQSKLPGYILPAVPAGAVLLAAYLFNKFEQESSFSRWLLLAHALVACAPVVPAILIAYIVTKHGLPRGKPTAYAAAIAIALCAAIVLTLSSRLRLRMLRFVTLIPVVLTVAAVLKIGSNSIDDKLSTRPLALELASIETHKLPVAVFGTTREVEFGLAFYRDQTIYRYESGQVPAGEHLLVAPATWMDNVEKATTGRRVTWLGQYSPQGLDYFWISAAGAKR
ncbi:MAG TPA: glycosyltransferase family 39 protein [Candidatus Acidoferrum sp.]|nr:glycosyltransferase family 39 protein [Candidatus Acidoferrum sp.]HTZ83451.1 glycosyltransferase family 39 protein [Candidatus Acidoferrales bacterium]